MASTALHNHRRKEHLWVPVVQKQTAVCESWFLFVARQKNQSQTEHECSNSLLWTRKMLKRLSVSTLPCPLGFSVIALISLTQIALFSLMRGITLSKERPF